MLRRNEAVREQLRLPVEQQDLAAIPLRKMPEHFEAQFKLFEGRGRNLEESDFQINLRTGRLDPQRLRDEG